MTRHFMSIPEAVNLIIHAACLTRGNDTYMLKMGEVVRIVELAERMIRLRGLRPYRDVHIEFTGIRPGEKLHEELFDDSNETLVETVHPNIVELKSQGTTFDAARCMNSIDALLQKPPVSSGSETLEMLQDIIKPHAAKSLLLVQPDKVNASVPLKS
jgi:FlaA1/EpsC-like NDP-sugar epimerase